MVELLVNGRKLQLSRKDNVMKYNIQIGDIYDIASVASSYTNSFSIPKTPENTQILEQLGLRGDTSTLPYKRVPVSLKNYGYDVIPSGWLSIKETSDEYKVSVIDGMIDFFKAIDNKTLGVDLDLSGFNHVKDMATVISSFNPTSLAPYKYLIADYNGENRGLVGVTTGINIDYLVPSFSVRKLWDLIFNTFGFTYTYDELSFLNDLYITYPLPPAVAPEPELYVHLTKDLFVTNVDFIKYGRRIPIDMQIWDSVAMGAGAMSANAYVIPETGGYRISIDVEAYGKFFGSNIPLTINVYKNGNLILTFLSDPNASVHQDYEFHGVAGDKIEYYPTVANGSNSEFIEYHHKISHVRIYKINLGEVSLTDAFKDFKIKDFIKEIIWRTGLTPVINTTTNHIRFVTLSKRVGKSNHVDWSGKYIRRTKEVYTQGDYAQKNGFVLQHDNPLDISGNGYLYVNNRNLPDEKKIAESKMFAPEFLTTEFVSVGSVVRIPSFKYKIWNREPKVNDEDGTTTIEYKGLSNRFYLLRKNTSNSGTWSFVSPSLNTTQTITSTLPYATIFATLFDELISSNYLEYSDILSNFRAHDIEVSLSLTDILGLDLTRPYYFAQEAQFYILNKLTYQDGDTCIGEFIRINNLQ
jgi:hypothetical protein